MAYTQCIRGHSYDSAKHKICPICAKSRDGVTRPLMDAPAAHVEMPKTRPLDEGHESKTVILNSTDAGLNPVTGWLVVISGEQTGLDFKIYKERNYLGTHSDNDICIDFDPAISEHSAVIIYDDLDNKFYITSGESKNNIYLNNKLLLDPKELMDNDILRIGSTQFMFKPFCNEKFRY